MQKVAGHGLESYPGRVLNLQEIGGLDGKGPSAFKCIRLNLGIKLG